MREDGRNSLYDELNGNDRALEIGIAVLSSAGLLSGIDAGVFQSAAAISKAPLIIEAFGKWARMKEELGPRYHQEDKEAILLGKLCARCIIAIKRTESPPVA